MSLHRANKEDAGADGYCRGCGTTIGEPHHSGCDLERITELEAQLAQTEEDLIAEYNARNTYFNRVCDLEEEIALMRPVVEAFGRFNQTMNTKYKNMVITLAERGKAMTALQTAYREYEQPTQGVTEGKEG